MLACADDQRRIRERNERNNCRASAGRVRVIPAKQPASRNESSTQLIDSAVAKGAISAETGLVYNVFALHADPRLPPEYRGKGGEGIDDSLMGDIASKFETLSARARATLAPFFIPPYYAGSWWALQHGAVAPAASARARALAQPTCHVDALLADWESTGTGNNQVRIWWQTGQPNDQARAMAMAKDIDTTIWPKLASLMKRSSLPDGGSTIPCRGGDDRLDIALVPGLGRAETLPNSFVSCSETSSHINLPNAGTTRGTLVHELMHAFQYTYKTAGSCDEYRWWREASAQWAEDYVYPTEIGNVEQLAADLYLSMPGKPLEFKNDKHEYGAYLFPFLLARTLRPELIQTIWANDGSYDSLAAINTLSLIHI